MLFIGITGGVGAGKSEVLKFISQHYKCEIHLADEVAHKVKRKGTECYNSLVELLSSECLDEDGEIDNVKMAAIIFQDSSILKRVNEIIHPAVKEYLLNAYNEALAEADIELFFVEAALLIETGYKAVVDEMWYIYATEDIRRNRLKEQRGYSKERIDGIIDSQLSEDKFRQNCDFVIDNSGDLEKTYQQIRKKLEDFTWQR